MLMFSLFIFLFFFYSWNIFHGIFKYHAILHIDLSSTPPNPIKNLKYIIGKKVHGEKTLRGAVIIVGVGALIHVNEL